MSRAAILRSAGAALALVALAALWRGATPAVSAHKALLSKFGYNTDVFPILRDRCGACHVKNGVGPMSLLTYQDAFPWAQAIKEEVLGLRMPPLSNVRPGAAFTNVHPLTPREMDVLVDWANGATPEGEESPTPEAPPSSPGWTLGEPDIQLEMPDPFTLGPGELVGGHEFVVPTGLTAERWLRAIDVRPGAPAMVRAVTVWLRPPSNAGIEESAPLARWVPGRPAASLDPSAGFRLPARAELVVHVAYRKTWSYEMTALTDRTAVGLYLHKRVPGDAVVTAELEPAHPAYTDLVSVARVTPGRERLLAIMPSFSPTADLDRLSVELERPDGSRRALLVLDRPSPDWQTRLWLSTPVALDEGSQLVASAHGVDAGRAGLRCWVDVVREEKP
jgi:hypothetical protein